LVTPVSNCRPRPTHHRLKIRALTHASVRPLRRAVGRLSPTCGTGTAPSLSSGYENRRRWKISPLRRFFLLAEVSSTISSPLASRHATSPFFDSFGGFTPLLVCSFCPSLHDHRARISASTTPLATDLRSTPVSSCSCAPRH
jgi:hypothetical protein